MKRYIAMSMAALLCMLAGCAGLRTRHVITAEKFQKVMEKAGYTVLDMGSEAYKAAGVTQVLQAVKGADVGAIFFVGETTEKAEKVFGSYKELSDINREANDTLEETAGKNFVAYELSSSGSYYYFARVDNTLLYFFGPADEKNEIDRQIKALGY
ncbi:MAG: hypothetical protein LBN26_09300 [Christensenellaceae bacterium]|jgi:hypothetical protein|nr:hypothetical protein [Christensenellaceae bacterium]